MSILLKYVASKYRQLYQSQIVTQIVIHRVQGFYLYLIYFWNKGAPFL